MSQKRKKPTPLHIAICIPAYNREDYIAEALASCPASIPGHKLSVHVFDNSSSDGTVALVRRDFPHVDVQVNLENLGYVGNINRCLSLASDHDWIVILHSDDLLDVRAVIATAARLEDLSDHGMIFGLNETLGQPHKHPSRAYFSNWQAGDAGVVRMQSSVPCSGIFYNSRAISQVGLFSPDYPFSADEEYHCRIARDFPITCSNLVISKYRRHDNNTMLETWRQATFIPNFLAMRLAMNAMLVTPMTERAVREAVARTLAGQIPHCLRLGEQTIAGRFADFALANTPPLRLRLGMLARIAWAKTAGIWGTS
jgi:glycosyltransferase involved in cell wall biosynthesis